MEARQVCGRLRRNGLPRSYLTGEIAVALERHDFRELSMRGAHGEVAAVLPRHHEDPFHRLLIAQARVEGLILVTHDEAMTSYDVPLLRYEAALKALHGTRWG